MGGAPPLAWAEDQAPSAYGGWVSNGPCLPVDPPIGKTQFGCVGSEDWVGPLNALVYYTGSGTFDPVNTGITGQREQQAVVVAADGTYGTLHLFEQFFITSLGNGPDSLHFTSSDRILGGTGGFSGARGALYFDGVDTIVPGGAGTYADVAHIHAAGRGGDHWQGSMNGQVWLPAADGGTRAIHVGAPGRRLRAAPTCTGPGSCGVASKLHTGPETASG
jgi:hypothetical protein